MSSITRETQVVPKKKKKKFVSAYTVVFTLLIVALLGIKVYGDAQLNELTLKASSLKNELSELQNEKKRLNISLEKRTDLSTIELRAQTELGLIKIDKNQIEYISIPSEDKVEYIEDVSSGIFDEALRQFSIFLEFLS
ncbi:MAG: hypothetical protein E7480_05245 [Ruminococcaceae bacterium]|nr:hypothetical protein [Oscillospiraceae bacterium]